MEPSADQIDCKTACVCVFCVSVEFPQGRLLLLYGSSLTRNCLLVLQGIICSLACFVVFVMQPRP